MIGIYTVWENLGLDCNHDQLVGIYNDKDKMMSDFPDTGKKLSNFYWIWITINRDRRGNAYEI